MQDKENDMEANCYQVLLVGDSNPDSFLIQKPAPNLLEIKYLRVFTYRSAVYSTQRGLWDAVFVTPLFDDHTGLEFIQHARLFGSQVPIILLCEKYDANLEYKARKIGATDCISVSYLTSAYIYDLLTGRKDPTRESRKTNKPAFLRLMESLLT